MLQELSIRNFAIIEDINIRFQSGLTVLSGETGAGKSIIINAVNLLLGSRVSANLIRTGAESAELEALFHIDPHSRAAERMAQSGYDAADGLLVRRIISRSDRHRIYLNGRLATAQVLVAITADLASISGQHAHQRLLKEEEHLHVLDRYAGLLALREEYGAAYRRLLPLIQQERELIRRKARQGEQIELLRFQQSEIEAAGLSPKEDETLEKERLRLKNGQTLYESAQQCIDGLYGAEGALIEQLGHLGRVLDKASQIDDQLAPCVDAMHSLSYGVEDLAAMLRDYLGRIDLDPRQLDAVEERLDTLNRLKRKYGGHLEAVLEFGIDLEKQLAQFDHLDDALEEVRADLGQCHEQSCQLAATLSRKRARAAHGLAREVVTELAALKMDNTNFSIDLIPISLFEEGGEYLNSEGGGLTESGMDRAQFMISPNVGEALKSLAGIASGGELSRVVLALKAILANSDAVETVVFDEVDAGIGGGVAEVVGRKLAELSRHHQVLCITHLPQIAKFGGHHFRIVKAVSDGRTHTTITPLDKDQRVKEIARMLGGEKITSMTLNHAQELLRKPEDSRSRVTRDSQ